MYNYFQPIENNYYHSQFKYVPRQANQNLPIRSQNREPNQRPFPKHFVPLSHQSISKLVDVKIRKCTNRSSNKVYLSTDIDPTRTTLLSTKIYYFICYLINRNLND